jgi:hypothetical protein
VGLLSRLLSKTSTTAAEASKLEASLYSGNETLEVVGESNHQDVLWKIVGGHRSERVRYHTHAVLMPEPDNPVDPNAIQVLVAGNLVGYLSRQDALAYRPGLLRLMNDSVNGLVAFNAIIVGGGQRGDGLGKLGIFLDHDPTDFGIRSQRADDTAGFRTGFSEAVTTDLEDDTYDLSWHSELSDNDTVAIKQLRTMLETDSDPIDRHYMMSELEKRLYKCRDVLPSALDDFDALCQHHHSEMVTIRPALFEKFGRIPLIDTYRQAAVRCQKVRDWDTMRHWAERGIKVYGDHAARQEAVEDLRKRLEYANAKIEAATKPKLQRPAKAVVTITAEKSGEIEKLTCANCGSPFERVRTRGRKPHACPACRGV